MKYTNNAGTKLLNMGFEFQYTHKDDEIEYDVYNMTFTNSIENVLEATVDITNKTISFFVVFEDAIKLNTERDVKNLIKLAKKISI